MEVSPGQLRQTLATYQMGHLSIQVLRELLAVLLPRVQLEVHYVSTVLSHLLMITDINLLGTLTNQTHIVRNHENSPLELIQASCKGIDRLHIERVRRLVQQESKNELETEYTGIESIRDTHRCGRSCAMMANTIRAFCPALSCPITCCCWSPVHPYLPSKGLIFSMGSSGMSFCLK